jgi:hypothetical protein
MKKLQTNDIHSLEFLIGNWNTEGEIIDGGRITGSDSYEWVLNKSFILHKVDVTMDGKQIEAIELIGEYDSKNRSFKMRSFDTEGTCTTMEAKRYGISALLITGDKMRSKLSVIDANTMTAHWEKSDDNVKWQPWIDLRFSK